MEEGKKIQGLREVQPLSGQWPSPTWRVGRPFALTNMAGGPALCPHQHGGWAGPLPSSLQGGLVSWASRGAMGMAVATPLQRYVAAMVLSGVGDALGYNGGAWEFCGSGERIHAELEAKGGLDRLNVKDWRVSDDTVMHLATAEALAAATGPQDAPDGLMRRLAEAYRASADDMEGRAPGNTCLVGISLLRPAEPGGWKIPFNPKGGGCGAAMRAMCIGLRYPHLHQLETLIAVAVESGRMTHHHPTGYLGALTAALFTAYAVNGRPPVSWGKGLMEVLEKARSYVQTTEHYVAENMDAWPYFKDQWSKYLQLRGIEDGVSAPVFPKQYGVAERDEFYTSVSFNGWGGASGHDAPMIAYDAILGAGDSWKKLCHRGVFHGGDNDSTGAIAAAWWGAMYGFHEVPASNYKNVEYKKRLESVAKRLLKLGDPSCQ
ncbi:ADP-ribosylhydrolase ARH1-like [Narcine bancroftii]|uniref:ADP-ribosylhydrolase ARH1-like n=1 Tax=Narcine bancroftii TaxID=1343680 RepID=UPI003831F12B